MLFSTYGQAVLTLHERHSRLLLAARSPSKEAHPIANSMSSILCPLPPQWRQTVTFDNGTEFAQHHQLHALGFQTFFCDTRSPWQKGGIENAIGRLRRTLPRKTDLATLSDDRSSWCRLTIIPRENASATILPLRHSGTRCCTSNVNPHSRFRGNDELGGCIEESRRGHDEVSDCISSDSLLAGISPGSESGTCFHTTLED